MNLITYSKLAFIMNITMLRDADGNRFKSADGQVGELL